MLLFNRMGLVLFLVSFGAGYGITRALDWPGEGVLMMIAGPILFLLDAGYRKVRGLPLLRYADEGGTVLYLAAWIWGLFWTALGAWYHLGR